MKRAPLPWPVFLAGYRFRIRLVALALAGSLVASVPAQDESGEPSPPSADSQAVDEEEAEFRRRMELEEGPDDERTSPADLPELVEVDPAEAPEDRLPPSSREHLEERLTELIIENGRWNPEDAEREAEFEPSDAARSDPELAAKEAEAWEEMVAAYHEREQSAWSGNPGTGGEPGDAQQSAAGAGSGSGSGAGSGAGSGGGPGGGQGAAAAADRSAQSSAERAPTGEPFSALEFLGGADASDRSPDPTEPDVAVPEATTPPDRASEEPPGAVDPAALEVLFSSERPVPGTDLESDEPSEPGASSESDEPSEPGAPSEPDMPSQPVELPEPGAPAESGEPPDTAAEPVESTSAGEPPETPVAVSPPPEPSIWDWLRGLFGSEPEPEPDTRSG